MTTKTGGRIAIALALSLMSIGSAYAEKKPNAKALKTLNPSIKVFGVVNPPIAGVSPSDVVMAVQQRLYDLGFTIIRTTDRVQTNDALMIVRVTSGKAGEEFQIDVMSQSGQRVWASRRVALYPNGEDSPPFTASMVDTVTAFSRDLAHAKYPLDARYQDGQRGPDAASRDAGRPSEAVGTRTLNDPQTGHQPAVR